MAKQTWEPCSILSPVPAVLVTVRGKDGRENVLTIAWTGTVCSSPAMVYISVRKERFSHPMFVESGEFVINLTTKELAHAADYCGVKSGRNEDKFETAKLKREPASVVQAPLLSDSPVNIECKVEQILELGSHDMFLAKVVAVDVDERYLDENGKLDLSKANLIGYVHGAYFELGKQLGTFGQTVRKRKPRR